MDNLSNGFIEIYTYIDIYIYIYIWGIFTKWPSASYWCGCFWPNRHKQPPWVWHEGPTSSRGTCAHRPALCSLIGISERTPELEDAPLAPRSLLRWEQVHNEHMWQACKSLETSSVMVQGDISLHRLSCHSQRYSVICNAIALAMTWKSMQGNASLDCKKKEKKKNPVVFTEKSWQLGCQNNSVKFTVKM